MKEIIQAVRSCVAREVFNLMMSINKVLYIHRFELNANWDLSYESDTVMEGNAIIVTMKVTTKLKEI